MNKRQILILITALHVCIFTVAVILIRIDNDDLNFGRNQVEIVGNRGNVSETEPVTETVPESDIETMIETEAEEVKVEEVEVEETEVEETEVEETKVEEMVIEETETDTEIEEVQTFKCISGKLNLNIREQPSTSSNIIGIIPNNDTGTVLSVENDEWAYIEYNGIKGYCIMRCIIVE